MLSFTLHTLMAMLDEVFTKTPGASISATSENVLTVVLDIIVSATAT